VSRGTIRSIFGHGSPPAHPSNDYRFTLGGPVLTIFFQVWRELLPGVRTPPEATILGLRRQWQSTDGFSTGTRQASSDSKLLQSFVASSSRRMPRPLLEFRLLCARLLAACGVVNAGIESLSYDRAELAEYFLTILNCLKFRHHLYCANVATLIQNAII
jgi:hypothetical protein